MTPEPVRIRHDDAKGQGAFLRWVPRVFPGLDFRPWHARGGWTPAYEAHAFAQDGEVVASVSAMRMRLIVSGREVRGAQLGAVGCLPEMRGQGRVRTLLESVLARLEAEADLVLLYANPDALDLYPRFGFRRERESDFEMEVSLAPSPDPAPRLDLDDPHQVAGWVAACATAAPPTERFGARDYGAVALWHACVHHPRDVRVLREGEAYAVAVQRGDTLHLLDVAAPRGFDLLPALPRLVGAPAARVRFGFCPERGFPGARRIGGLDDALFVRGGPPLPAAPFRFPALAQT